MLVKNKKKNINKSNHEIIEEKISTIVLILILLIAVFFDKIINWNYFKIIFFTIIITILFLIICY